MGRIVELRNPKALMMPNVMGLLKRVLKSDAFLNPVELSDAAEDLLAFVIQDNQFMFLGAENGDFKSMMLVSAITSPLFPLPFIIADYNEGTRSLHREMKTFAVDRLVGLGYTRVMAMNGTAASDEVWQRAMALPGLNVIPLGTIHTVEIK